MLVQTEDKNYVRDTHSRALLATSKNQSRDYEFKKKLVNENKALKEELTELKDQMALIKQKLGIE